LRSKLIVEPYPFRSLKICFVPNLFLKHSRKQSIDFTGGLHIMDEEILFAKTQLEGRNRTYKYLASALAFDYFGGKVFEESPEDTWLLVGVRESIGNHYQITRMGVLLYRYHIMQTIESVYKKAKHGIERSPLRWSGQFNLIPNPNEYLLNELLYEKAELVMHMIESMIDKSYFERIIRELYR
jgi:DNA-binding phage protein